MVSKNDTEWVFVLLFVSFIVFFVFTDSGMGNPIPVNPRAAEIAGGTNILSLSEIDPIWVSFIFVLDYCLNLFLLYGGLLLAGYLKWTEDEDLSWDFSRTGMILSVLVITLTGFFSELFLGQFLTGLILALFFIFLSFVLTGLFVLRLNKKSVLIIGFFAVCFNIVFWLIFYVL